MSIIKKFQIGHSMDTEDIYNQIRKALIFNPVMTAKFFEIS